MVGSDPRGDLAAVIVAWGRRVGWRVPHLTPGQASVMEVRPDESFWGKPWSDGLRPVLSAFVAGRFLDAANQASRRQRGGLVSLPTRVLGWIDANVLLDRLSRHERSGPAVSQVDATQAIMRLAVPDSGSAEDLVRSARALRSPAALAFRAALGDVSAVPKTPELRAAADWVAAGARPPRTTFGWSSPNRRSRFSSSGPPTSRGWRWPPCPTPPAP